MKADSEDVRQSIVQAVQQRWRSKPEATGLFSISLSSLKRYTKLTPK